MLPLVLVALSAQIQITDVEVPAILETVVEYMTTHEAIFGEKPLANRPVFLSAETADAFREILPGVSLRIPDAGRQHAVRAEDEVVLCRAGSCEIIDDGVLLTIRSVTSADEPGEYHLFVYTRWNDQAASGGLEQDLRRLTVAKPNDDWRVTDDIYMEYSNR